ncbi:MAG: hypothetical protein ACKO34_01050 [Vampirovibrionales bacterium]
MIANTPASLQQLLPLHSIRSEGLQTMHLHEHRAYWQEVLASPSEATACVLYGLTPTHYQLLSPLTPPAPEELAPLTEHIEHTLRHGSPESYVALPTPAQHQSAFYSFYSRLANPHLLTFGGAVANQPSLLASWLLQSTPIVWLSHRPQPAWMDGLNVVCRIALPSSVAEVLQQWHEIHETLTPLLTQQLEPPCLVLIDAEAMTPCIAEALWGLCPYKHTYLDASLLEADPWHAEGIAHTHPEPTQLTTGVACVLTALQSTEHLLPQLTCLWQQTLLPKEIHILTKEAPEAIQTNLQQSHLPAWFLNNIHWHTQTKATLWNKLHLSTQCQTPFVAWFDEGILPAPRWLETCFTHSLNELAIYGGMGAVIDTPQAYPKGGASFAGWAQPIETAIRVDVVGHAWFFPRAVASVAVLQPTLIETLLPLAGESLWLSAMAQQWLDLPSKVPATPSGESTLWSHQPQLPSCWPSLSAEQQAQRADQLHEALQTLLKQGYRLLLEVAHQAYTQAMATIYPPKNDATPRIEDKLLDNVIAFKQRCS